MTHIICISYDFKFYLQLIALHCMSLVYMRVLYMKIGHFRKKALDKNSNKEERETESVRISGMSKTNAYAIT